MGAWTREDWNNIIQQVNNLAQNPDSSCDPVDTLEEVGPDHIWTKTDINDVQNKLIEICGDNSFSAELRLWAQDIIDEINDAIANGWCDCNPCLPECSNAQGNVEIYGGSFSVTDCRNCGECGSGTCPPTCTQAERNAAVAAGNLANSKIGDWADAWSAYCTLSDEVDKLQKELDALQDQLDALNDQLDALETARDEACAHGTPEECAAAQAAVDAKQAELDAKQAELDAKTNERDAKLSEADGYEAEAETAAAESISLANAVGADVCQTPYSSFIAGDGAWADVACDKLGPMCLGRDPRRCRVWWSVHQRTTTIFSWDGSVTGDWDLKMGGAFTRTGNPYVTNIADCGGVQRYACKPCCQPPCPLPPCSTPCPVTYIYEVRCIMAYPNPTGEECCE
jgi:hypothetical protein